MNSVFNKIVAFVLSLVLLLTTITFTVNLHYCSDVLVEAAVFKNTKGCKADTQKTTSEICSVVEKNCCSDKQLVFEGQEELQKTTFDISLKQLLFVTSFIQTYINRFEDTSLKPNTYQDYKPPLVSRQIYKLDETYLI